VTFDASASTYTDTSCDTASLTWDFGDGSPGMEGVVVTHSFGQDGTYTVCLTVQDNAGSSTTCKDIEIDIVSSVRSVRVDGLDIYPNPSKGVVHLHLDSDQVVKPVFEISNMQGQNVSGYVTRTAFHGLELSVTLEGLPSGMYTVSVVDGSQYYIGQFVIIRK
ncbi:MAG: PKD domain-containing protein, partial [Saprospiraceae bacterium]|nr:PKD domain-containing protein [Saprospiraceae bacterium]